MGALTKNPTTSVNPNSPQQQGLQGDYANFLSQLLGGSGGAASGPAKPANFDKWPGGLQQDWLKRNPSTPSGPLQRIGQNPFLNFLSQPSPEMTTYNNLNSGLMDLFKQGVDPKLSGGLMDIFGLDTAAATGAAAMPLFQQGLQFAQGQLANSGRGRFSTAFENQGIGLSQRALQDFNLLQQQAFTQNIGNRLGAAQMLGNLTNQNAATRLGAGGLLGTLSGQAGSSMRDPILQLLLGGMSFAQPAPNDTVVEKSFLDHVGGFAQFAPWNNNDDEG